MLGHVFDVAKLNTHLISFHHATDEIWLLSSRRESFGISNLFRIEKNSIWRRTETEDWTFCFTFWMARHCKMPNDGNDGERPKKGRKLLFFLWFSYIYFFPWFELKISVDGNGNRKRYFFFNGILLFWCKSIEYVSIYRCTIQTPAQQYERCSF